ncbi:hypothetical protein GCM10009769_00420 [Curtobacterium luteum]|uniref:Uncharacterized protein n=1 Tax=Curtobacterium luteum TaxID=33881 RepID=A0A8H9G6M6_9MICO|nr:hypothetical protein GCM10009769_00420 [Curtobacterium luteum]
MRYPKAFSIALAVRPPSTPDKRASSPPTTADPEAPSTVGACPLPGAAGAAFVPGVTTCQRYPARPTRTVPPGRPVENPGGPSRAATVAA